MADAGPISGHISSIVYFVEDRRFRIEATYCRVILWDATPCSKRGSFKPSINPAADHEQGL